MRLRLALVVLSLVLLLARTSLAWQWSYSDGESAPTGWCRSSRARGWVCKTWEGELSMAVPGSLAVERFEFTV